MEEKEIKTLSSESEEEKTKRAIKEANEETRKEAKKARRQSPAMMAAEIRRMVKKTANPDEPTEAKYARALIGVFLKELSAHRHGRHVTVTKRLLADLKEKQPIQLKQDGALALAHAALRHEITFGKVALR